MKELLTHQGPFRHPNLRLFAWFQLLYNARAYYPVMAIFFVDLGLTLDQFVTLNLVWALAIVFLEVPSGALADVMGRRRLLILASTLMSLEMAILVFAPAKAGPWLFGLCVVNRLMSGASEAAASGADQALAYDTLEAAGEQELWDEALSTAMSWQSAGFMIAMGLGGLLYTPDLINRGLEAAGSSWQLDREIALRLPVILVWIQSFACLVVTWKMREPSSQQPVRGSLGERASATWHTTVKAALWVWRSPLALTLVTGGFLIDAVLRNFATINSQYYRMIEVPEWTYGFIAAGSSSVGILVPKLARRLGRRLPPVKHLLLVFGLALIGITLLAPAWPYWGILPAVFCLILLGWNSFIMNRHLNELTPSHQRATVLSVRGLASNLAYGSYSLLFASLLALTRPAETAGESTGLGTVLGWQPAYFVLTLAAFICFARRGQQSLNKSI